MNAQASLFFLFSFCLLRCRLFYCPKTSTPNHYSVIWKVRICHCCLLCPSLTLSKPFKKKKKKESILAQNSGIEIAVNHSQAGQWGRASARACRLPALSSARAWGGRGGAEQSGGLQQVRCFNSQVRWPSIGAWQEFQMGLATRTRERSYLTFPLEILMQIDLWYSWHFFTHI